jgi:hypothetical protein
VTAEIFADTGERLTQALVTGEFELYRQAMDLPIEIIPRTGKPRVLQDIDDLTEDFGIYRQTITLWKVTDIYRKPLSIRHLADGLLEVTCEMHIMADGTRIVDPFTSIMTLRHTEEGWKFCRIHSSLGHINWTFGQADISDSGSFTHR